MKRSLPQSLDQVGGMRAARWFRESTAGQWDNFGPDAQREQQDRAIARYGLADSALEWSVASSGWTSAWRTPTWEAMVASAQAGAFDVLVVGYVSRFLRNLKQTLIAVEYHLHAAGVAKPAADDHNPRGSLNVKVADARAGSSADKGATMRQVGRIGWAGLAISAVAAALGLVLAVGSAIAAGDWDLAPMPWIGIGMTLTVVGLAGAACFALLLDVVEPIGWWRLLAVPPGLLVGAFWAFVLIVGLPTTGGTDFDVPTILYTLPTLMAVLVIATVALALPAVVGRRVAAGR